MANLPHAVSVSDAAHLRAGQITDAFREPVILLDLSFCVTAWNVMCVAMSGKTAEQALGRPFFALFSHAADNPKLINAMKQARDGYAAFLPAEDCQYTPGSFDNHFVPLKNEQGDVIGIMHTRHDIAHRLLAITELEQLNKKLVQKNAELIQWAKTLQAACKSIAGYLYEPVSKMYSFTHTLLAGEEDNLSAPGRKYLNRIKNLANSAKGFTERIIEYLMLDNAKEHFSDVDLSQIFRLIRNNLGQEIADAGATLDWQKLPVIMGDRRLIYLMFSELVTNALRCRKACTPLKIEVSGGQAFIELLSEDRPVVAVYSWVKISDNGIGFEGKNAADLFQPFRRGAERRNTPGYGIGLAMCEKIANRHQAIISARATATGTTFTCSFPVSNTKASTFENS